MGAACAPCPPATWQALSDYGAAIGLAFQIVDDILDATQASEALGKTAGKDASDGKPTYVSLLGLEAARAEADRLHDRARQALQQADLARPEALAALAERVVCRDH